MLFIVAHSLSLALRTRTHTERGCPTDVHRHKVRSRTEDVRSSSELSTRVSVLPTGSSNPATLITKETLPSGARRHDQLQPLHVPCLRAQCPPAHPGAAGTGGGRGAGLWTHPSAAAWGCAALLSSHSRAPSPSPQKGRVVWRAPKGPQVS